MSLDELKALRSLASVSQKAFALEMGVPLRTYEDLESGRTDVRPIHLNAAKWALFVLLANSENIPVDVPDDIADLILNAAKNIEKDRARIKPPSQK